MNYNLKNKPQDTMLIMKKQGKQMCGDVRLVVQSERIKKK